MAILRIPKKNAIFRDLEAVRSTLAAIGIEYQRWQASYDVSPDASEDEILQAYSPEIEKLKLKGGYSTVDVIDLIPTTLDLDKLLAKFCKEHWHNEDEIRFIIKGRGIFHIAPAGAEVVSIEMEAGDLICVPKGTLHWFDLCEDKTIRAIRLFQKPSGWTPYYTESGTDAKFQPLCLGPDYISRTN